MAQKNLKGKVLGLLFYPVKLIHRMSKALYFVLVLICRLPVDYLLLTFHYVKGLLWLAIRAVKKKLGIKSKTSPYKCFTQSTIRGNYTCRPGKKYRNLVIFKTFCPDAHWESIESRNACCLATIIKKQHYWRPPTYRLVGVGVFLFISWSMISYAIFHFASATQMRSKNAVTEYRRQAQGYLEDKEYKKAVLAFRKAIDSDPNNADIHFELAHCLVEQESYGLALQQFEQAVRFNPELWGARLEYSRTALVVNQGETALEQAQAVLESFPDHSEANFLVVHCLLQKGDIQGAESLLESTKEKMPKDNHEQFQLAAHAYHLLKNFSEAKYYYSKSIAVNPDYFDSRIGAAYIAILEQDWEAAAEHSGRVLEQDPLNIPALVCRADMLMRQGEGDNAGKEFDEIIELHSDKPRIRYRIATHLLNYGLGDKGVELLIQQITKTPNDTRSYLLLAHNYLKNDRYRIAVSHCKRVLAMKNADHERARRLLVSGYIGMKKYNLALDTINIVLASNPKDFTMTLLTAGVQKQLKNYDQAIEAYRETSSIAPTSWIPDIYLGALMSDLGEYNLAADSYRLALEKKPEDQYFRNNLAMALIESDQESNIKEAYEIMIQLDAKYPETPEVADTFGLALYKLGDYVNAQRVLENAIQVTPTFPELYYHLGLVKGKLGADKGAQASFRIALSLLKAVDSENIRVDKLRASLLLHLE